MSSDDTVKTTIRLPADLHWQFQSERAKRRLSNETAIRQAIATWIARPASRRRKLEASSARSTSLEAPGRDQEYVSTLLEMLRDFENHVEQMQRDLKAPGRDAKSRVSEKPLPDKKT
jgi:hypothetical protein